MKLTVVIITNRSDTRFESALESAQFADQVLIIDNNSQAEWETLKKKYSFKKIDHPDNINNFAEVRNKALKEVTTEWVLFLDSDEEIPESAQEKIQAAIATNQYAGYAVKRSDVFLGKKLQYGETGELYLIRLFQTKKGKFTRSVHEVAEVSGKVGTADFELIHTAHLSIQDFLQKINLYAQMESKNKKLTEQEVIFQMLVYPMAKFIFNYFFKLGFLDGFQGVVYAVLMSLHSFFVRVFYFESLQKK